MKALTIPCERRTLIENLQVKRPDLLDALLDVGLTAKELGIRNQLSLIRGKRSKAIMDTRGDMLAAMVQANFPPIIATLIAMLPIACGEGIWEMISIKSGDWCPRSKNW